MNYIYILIGLFVLILLYIILVFNKLIHLKNDVEEAFSTIDVYLKKRWDLVPNLVEVVKGYSKHEKDTLDSIVKLRNENYDDLSLSDKVDTNNVLDEKLVRLFALAEAYPELKASEQYLKLSKELVHLEDEIAKARKYYNAVVRIYNNKIEMFPSNFVAFLFRYKKISMFEAETKERKNIDISL